MDAIEILKEIKESREKYFENYLSYARKIKKYVKNC